MVRSSPLFLIGMLALLLNSCAGGGDSTASPSPSPTGSPAPTAAAPAPAPAPAKAAEPLVAQKPRAVTSDLIAPTNPDERVKQVKLKGSQKGLSSDPFQSIGPGADIAPPPLPKPVAATPAPPTPGKGTTAPNPSLVKLPTLPQLPQPELARAVQVSGVVQVGSIARAIVKAPDEPAIRYVSVGQRLSNGQILVKRIEMAQGSEPVVILEQFGVEVVKTIEKPGDKKTG